MPLKMKNTGLCGKRWHGASAHRVLRRAWGHRLDAGQLGEAPGNGLGMRCTTRNNTSRSGNAVYGRKDVAIDFDWGTGSHDPRVSADNFSTRWSRTLGFEPGTYRFCAAVTMVCVSMSTATTSSTPGKQHLPNTHYGDMTLGAGNHTVVVEYFEKAVTPPSTSGGTGPMP